ncbi:hypothetical protein QCA50_006222 [Cerrena zonata]|uniref:Uncharacterized protein n=1 Tax=Cerrena zonata TaxID=2478898 RepID=A0AAW0GNF3_9APHY
MRELFIIPKDDASLESIFEALSLCASLHPDPAGDNDMDDDDDAFIDASAFETFNGDNEQELSELGRAALDYMESIIDNPFEDKNKAVETNGKSGDESTGSEEEGKTESTANP